MPRPRRVTRAAREARRCAARWRGSGGGLLGGDRSTEMAGVSCFLRDGGEIFHTYSAYARGLDHTDLPYTFLDLTALGGQESGEEPKGRAPVLRDS